MAAGLGSLLFARPAPGTRSAGGAGLGRGTAGALKSHSGERTDSLKGPGEGGSGPGREVPRAGGGSAADPPAAPAPHLDPGPLALRGFALQPGADGAPQLGQQLLHHQVAQDLWRQEDFGEAAQPPRALPAQCGVQVLTWVSLPQSMSQVPYCSLDCRYMRMAAVNAGASTLESSEIPAGGNL